MIIYNLFPLLAGPFTKWEPHLQRAADMGFDWIFINPVQRLGASRSLYSISDYFSFNPALMDSANGSGADEQFRQMIERARALGLKVMIDLVINHCAMDSPLTRENRDWFVRQNGHIANASCTHNGQVVVWKDLAQFDHRHSRDAEGLYKFCVRIAEHLLGLGIEGFRCDAAYQVPRQFWQRLIGEVRSRHPKTVFVAETLGCTAEQTRKTANAGFDYVFNSSKYWNFHDWWLPEQYNLIRETTRSISFPESHDTPRLFAEANGNVNVMKQRYLFAALFSAGVLMPIGFEYGFRKPLHVINTTPADWEEPGVDLTGYMAKVNAIKKNHAIFEEEGPINVLHCHNPNVLLLWKISTRRHDEALLILNKDVWHHQDFYTDHFRHFIQSGAGLQDVSPEYPLDYIHEPFHYGLRPGQGIVLVTRR